MRAFPSSRFPSADFLRRGELLDGHSGIRPSHLCNGPLHRWLVRLRDGILNISCRPLSRSPDNRNIHSAHYVLSEFLKMESAVAVHAKGRQLRL